MISYDKVAVKYLSSEGYRVVSAQQQYEIIDKGADTVRKAKEIE